MQEPLWWLTKDGDLDCLEMYERHYSAYKYRDGRERKQFVGPGEKIVLRTERADAFFVWRNFIDDSGQQGVNCAAFRNEGRHLSSTLIQQADQIADCLWPDRRHYTYVDPQAVRSRNPGFCFIAAGWRRCGITKGGLVILERVPNCANLKTCRRCREELPADKEFFYGDKGEPDGLRHICKACYHELPCIVSRDQNRRRPHAHR